MALIKLNWKPLVLWIVPSVERVEINFQHRDNPLRTRPRETSTNAFHFGEAEVKASLLVGGETGEAQLSSPTIFLVLCWTAEHSAQGRNLCFVFHPAFSRKNSPWTQWVLNYYLLNEWIGFVMWQWICHVNFLCEWICYVNEWIGIVMCYMNELNLLYDSHSVLVQVLMGNKRHNQTGISWGGFNRKTIDKEVVGV